MKLEYALTDARGAYSSSGRVKPAAKNIIMHEMAVAAASGDESASRITTRISSLPIFIKHVMVLDCDSEVNMLAACHYMRVRDIGYCPITSSPSHYWLVTDVIGSIVAVTKSMQCVPGADRNHIRMSGRRIRIRAYPKHYVLPTFVEGHHTLSNQRAIEWYYTFRAHWESPELVAILDTMRIQKALSEGKMLDIAANPEFTV